ncbi:MAG TPA: CRISPR-associated endonuclease Cas2 [Planctomycetes bacterium]|nr:CRISPR-associated endonuclease Cas2 [Planctomycetota bacterium]
MSQSMLCVFAYDSPDDRRRARIARTLEDVADRVQGSVFEGWLSERQLEETWRRVQQVVDPAADDVRVYRLCSYCLQQARVLGPQPRQAAAEYWIV